MSVSNFYYERIKRSPPQTLEQWCAVAARETILTIGAMQGDAAIRSACIDEEIPF